MVSPSELNLLQEMRNLSNKVSANTTLLAAHPMLANPHPQYSLQDEVITSVCLLSSPASGLAWASMPAAQTMLFGSVVHLVKVYIGFFSGVKWEVGVDAAGFAGSTLELVYHTAYSSNPADFTPLPPAGSTLAIDSGGTVVESPWLDMDLGAATNIYLGVRGAGGDGATSPSFGQITVFFRG